MHSNADTANDVVNGSKAVSTAGSDELLVQHEAGWQRLHQRRYWRSVDWSHSRRVGGATASPSTAGEASPLMVIARMGRLLDQQNVDTTGRWLVVDPVF